MLIRRIGSSCGQGAYGRVESGDEYTVVWTPAFAEEVYLAVDYVQNHLKMPMAARDLLKGVEDALDTKRHMPKAAIRRSTPSGTEFYMTIYKRWNIYYTVEDRIIKAVLLKHQLQK